MIVWLMSILIKTLGTTWIQCPFKWGIENCQTIITKQGVKLILVNIEEHQNEHCFELKYEPVTTDSLIVYEGDK